MLGDRSVTYAVSIPTTCKPIAQLRHPFHIGLNDAIVIDSTLPAGAVAFAPMKRNEERCWGCASEPNGWQVEEMRIGVELCEVRHRVIGARSWFPSYGERPRRIGSTKVWEA